MSLPIKVHGHMLPKAPLNQLAEPVLIHEYCVASLAAQQLLLQLEVITCTRMKQRLY
jgi:hypothetical protein